MRSGRGAQTTPHPVTRHSAPDATADGVRDARRLGGRPDGHAAHHDVTSASAPASGQRAEGRSLTNRPDQAERRERPLARRRRRTARPAFVRIRRRKPCFLLRLRLFGWNVLFTHGLLGRPDHAARVPGAHAPSSNRHHPIWSRRFATRRSTAHSATAKGPRRGGHGARTAFESTAPASRPTIHRRSSRDDGDPPSVPRVARRSQQAACCVVHSADTVRGPERPGDGRSSLPPEIRRDGSRLTRLPASASAHVWTHLWTTLGSRYRGDTCRR
jgi:hypothetical protein